MDDPWGSPWATPDGQTPRKGSAGSHSKSNLDLAPPKPALLTTAAARNPSFSAKSPWEDGDDGDGFGDWASADTGATATGNVWGGWVADDPSSGSQHLTPTPREEGVGGESPIAWPGLIATASASRPRSLSRNRSPLSRMSSDDPWAAELSFNNDGPIRRDSLRAIVETPKLSSPDRNRDRHEARGLQPDALAEENGRALHNMETGTLQPPSRGTETATSAATPDIRVEGGSKPALAPSDSKKAPQQDILSAPQSLASRPSSPGSEDSHPGEGHPDSPITSIDEESKRRPKMPRKSSSKVQDLVDMYDGLAKTTVTEPVIAPSQADEGDASSREEEPLAVQATEDESSVGNLDADFGDFEDPLSRRPSKQSSALGTPERIPTPNRPAADRDTRQQEGTSSSRPASSDKDSSGKHQINVLSAFRELAAKYGPVTFQPDSKDIERLFDAKNLDSLLEITGEGVTSDVSDRIINDSFSNISERKTWYRISRQGTMLKHNSGDEDNYRRVTWQTSDARTRTIKIVRRWMEEDSFGGRAALGGSSGRGDAFGWNSKAKPVALDEVFRRKASAHARSTSLNQLHPPPPLSSPIITAPPRRASGKIQSPTQTQPHSPPTAQFGWSTVPNSAAPAANPPPAPRSGPESHFPKPLSRSSTFPLKNEAQIRPVSLPPSAKPHTALAISIQPLNEVKAADVDDDDEWGDMVTSPPADQGSFARISVDVQNRTSTNVPRGQGDLDNFAVPLASPTTSLNQGQSAAPSPNPKASHDNNSLSSPLPTTQLPMTENTLAIGAVPQASNDPWDFSFFDSRAPPAPPAPPIQGNSLKGLSIGVSSMPTSLPGPYPHMPTNPRIPSSIPPPANVASFSSREEEQKKIAQSILDSLPDLSYMLR